MTLSLAAVFIPILFMGGLVGRLFREFAVVIGVAVLISGVISLTLTPMLSSRFLRPSGEAHHGRVYAASERVFGWGLKWYGLSLAWVLNHRVGTMLVSGLILAGTVYLYTAIPKGFLPSEDRGQIMGSTEAAEGISFESLVEHQRAVSRAVREDPNIEAFMSRAGGTGGRAGSSGSNGGIVFIRLKPKADRLASIDEVIQGLRARVSQIPGI